MSKDSENDHLEMEEETKTWAESGTKMTAKESGKNKTTTKNKRHIS